MSHNTTLEGLIDEFLEYCEIERGHSELTIRNYEHYLIRFLEYIKKEKRKENPKPSDITLELVRKYRIFLNRLDSGKGDAIKKITQNYHVIAASYRAADGTTFVSAAPQNIVVNSSIFPRGWSDPFAFRVRVDYVKDTALQVTFMNRTNARDLENCTQRFSIDMTGKNFNALSQFRAFKANAGVAWSTQTITPGDLNQSVTRIGTAPDIFGYIPTLYWKN